MLGFEAERAGHAAAGRIEGLDLQFGDQPQCLGRGAGGVERLLMAMAVQQRGAARHRRQLQLEAAGRALAGDEFLEQLRSRGQLLGFIAGQ